MTKACLLTHRDKNGVHIPIMARLDDDDPRDGAIAVFTSIEEANNSTFGMPPDVSPTQFPDYQTFAGVLEDVCHKNNTNQVPVATCQTIPAAAGCTRWRGSTTATYHAEP